MPALSDIDVVVVDCQATGATPALGDLLELGWTVASARDADRPATAHWVVPRSGRKVPRVVRQLTGFTEACLDEALPDERCWSLLRAEALSAGAPAKAVIHFARFELGFLRDLHARCEQSRAEFPLEVVCLHAIAQRLFPDLPRRSLRALAGMHGFPAEQVRRSEGHVRATAFLWRALVPKLAARGVTTWEDLRVWLSAPPPKRGRRAYPIAPEKKRNLPSGPGVYRFVRPNGDVLYVGKAASVKRRVAAHFASPGRATERALEMLTQATDIAVTKTESAVEAALLEVDEIRRLDPPYNVQLKGADARAWFSTRDLAHAASAPDDAHRVGPLPSRGAVSGLAAIAALASGADATAELAAAATGVPPRFGPDERAFAAGWSAFARARLPRPGRAPMLALLRAARDVSEERGEEEEEVEAAAERWDPARVARRLDRSLARGAELVRRARRLCILADAVVTFREADDVRRRVLVVRGAEIVSAGADAPGERLPASTWHARRACFDRARYDRLRVLATELARVSREGGDVAVHAFGRELRWR